MMTTATGQDREPERIVRQYFDGLRRGRIVDALDVFATDAVLRDEKGAVHRGIREIAASFARGRHARAVDVVALTRESGRVTAVVDVRGTEEGTSRHRAVFHVDGERVRSLTVTPLAGRPARRTARRGKVPATARREGSYRTARLVAPMGKTAADVRVKAKETVRVGGLEVTNRTTNSITVRKTAKGLVVTNCCLEEQGM